LVDFAGDADILVNNAGSIPGGDLWTVDEAAWRAGWELKVFGYINLTRAFYPLMKARGSGVIVNNIGVAGSVTDFNYIAGATGNAADRPHWTPAACTSEPVAWFLNRGFAVALPLRRGYGPLGTPFAEATGACPEPDYAAGGAETARDIPAALAYARALPGVDASRPAVVLGQSAGGWGAEVPST
jgi:NAD(P)-dependent dehydrogenase (short-subunit alcohol dehydrogenase family)